MRKFLTVAFCLLASALSASSSLADDMAVETWIRNEWKRLKEAATVPGIRLQIRYEQHWYPGPSAFKELEDRVAGRPDHPDRSLYTIYKQRRDGTPSSFLRTVWFGESNTWRINEEFLSPEFPQGQFSDAAGTPKSAFFLQNGSLSIMDPRDGAPPGKDPGSPLGTAKRTSQILLSGGMWLATQADAQLENLRITGNEWTFDSVVPSGSRLAGQRWNATGTWLPQQSRGVIEQVQLLESPVGEELVKATPFEWERSAVTGTWIARKVEIRLASGQLKERFELEELATETQATIETLVQPPVTRDDKYVDPVRGAMTIRVVHDHRSGMSAVRTPTGSVASVPLPQEALSPVSGSSTTLSWIGWLSAGGLLLFLLLIRVRRGMKTA